MKEITIFLCLKSVLLFAAIVYTIFVIDTIVKNIMYYNRFSSKRFEIVRKADSINIIPIKQSLITLFYWWIFYMASNLGW
jgi:hypothetical protein